MTSVAIVLGAVILAFVLWLVAALLAGWRRDLGRFGFILVVGVVLHSAWLWWGVGVSPLERPAVNSQIAVLMYAGVAFAVGWLAARWSGRGRRNDTTDTEG